MDRMPAHHRDFTVNGRAGACQRAADGAASPGAARRSSASPAPKSAATPAIAAPAPCCSTASRVCACLVALGQVDGATMCRPSRASPKSLRHDAPPAGCLPAPRRRAVRHLHARHAGGGDRAARAQPERRPRPRPWMRSAACSAAAPAIARSSRPCLDCATPIAPRRIRCRPARRSGSASQRLDGRRKVDGHRDLRRRRSARRIACCCAPCARRTIAPASRFGDLAAYVADHPGILRVLTPRDVPGRRLLRPDPPLRRPADLSPSGEVRYRGEAVAAVVGDAAAIEALDLDAVPGHLGAAAGPAHDRGRPGRRRRPGAAEPARQHPDPRPRRQAAMSSAALTLRRRRRRRIRDRLRRACLYRARSRFRAARRRPDRDAGLHAVALHGPRRHRQLLGISPEQVRIMPTAVGGGFGSKLDLSVQPFIALAAWLTKQAGAHGLYAAGIDHVHDQAPSRRASACASAPTRDGKLHGHRFRRRFQHRRLCLLGADGGEPRAGACLGPLFRAALPRADARDPYASGARRRLPRLRRAAGGDRAGAAVRRCSPTSSASIALEFRIANALAGRSADRDRPGAGRRRRHPRLPRSAAPALAERARAEVEAFNGRNGAKLRRGVGVAGMWYGCGNTSLPNPSTIRDRAQARTAGCRCIRAPSISARARTPSSTQIAADALGAPVDRIDLVSADTDLTPDCGKTSASRQTFVTGKAAELAGAGVARGRSCAPPMPARVRGCSSAMARSSLRDGGRERALDLAEHARR